MIATILSALSSLSGLFGITKLANRVLDLIDQTKRWLFIQERTDAFDKAEQSLKEKPGDTSDLENLLRDPNRD